MSEHPLLAHHRGGRRIDLDLARVYAWDEQTAMVKLSGFCVTFVPTVGATEEMHPEMREHATAFLETPAIARHELPLFALSQWALRRRRVAFDMQRVGGSVYDRKIVRESLQWLHENRVSPTTPVDISWVPAKYHADFNVLVMRCDHWIGVVMCCRDGDTVGDDPLLSNEVKP